MSAAPDLAGFADAQRRLRGALGVDAAFVIREPASYGPDVPIDPANGRPYDPFAEPQTPATDREVVKRVGFVGRGVGEGSAPLTPLGAIDAGNAALILDPADKPAVEDATTVRIGGETYRIEQWREDPSLRTPRWLCFLEHA